MQGKPEILKLLNDRLSEELTAINQYMVHSEMCANWGLGKLHEAIEKQAFQEMHHAEWLIARIIFLEGTPSVSKLNPMTIGKAPREIILNDYASELDAVKAYNETIRAAVDAGDNGTRELIDKILKDEEDHVNWAEEQRDRIQQMGLESYLSQQM